MKLLAIEAAAGAATVALACNGEITQRTCSDPRAQAESLLPDVQALLDEHQITLSDLDALACGRGPGSFTALRVIAAFTQGLAYSAGKPVANVSTLAAMAQQVAVGSLTQNVSGVGERVLVCLDARKQQVYCAMFAFDEQGIAHRQEDEQVVNPGDVVQQFSGQAIAYGIGNGFGEYPELEPCVKSVLEGYGPTAKGVAQRVLSGAVEPAAAYLATPVYVRDNVTHGS